jgi:hypothetical protein
MPHVRETLIQALAAQIVAAGTSIASRVFVGRTVDLQPAEIPCAVIYQGDEATGPDEFQNKRRELELGIEIHGTINSALITAPTVQGVLNALALEVENAIEADPTLSGAILFLEHRATQTRIDQADTDRGMIRLDYVAHYRTARTDAGISV